MLRGECLSADAATQFGGGQPPVVDAFAVAEQVTKKSVELLGAAFAQRTATERFQYRFAVGFPDLAHDAAAFALVCQRQSRASRVQCEKSPITIAGTSSSSG